MDRDFPQKPLTSVLVKPAGPDCNLHCEYCFYLEKAALFPEERIHRMDLGLLEELIRQGMTQSGSQISFGWQGGEPTLMGLDFFKKAVAWQQKYGRGQSVGNGLQTNGILIDDDWCAFLKEYNFLVGLSLDGPELIHDRYRRLRNKKGTWKKVHESAQRMLDAGVSVNALVVLNDHSVRFPEEIYAYHKELDLTFMQFIPVIQGPGDKVSPSGLQASSSGGAESVVPKTDVPDIGVPEIGVQEFGITAEQFGAFLCTLFDLWVGDFENGLPTTSVRWFDSVFYSYVDLPPPECTLLEECGTYVVVEHNGDVYACDFYVEPEWRLGNIRDDSLTDLLNSSRQKEFGCMKSSLHASCLECPWLKYCRGGCTRERFMEGDLSGLNHRCEAYKRYFSHAHDRLTSLAEKWKRDQAAMARDQEREAAIAATQRKVGHVSGNAPTKQLPGRNDPCPCGSGRKFKKCCADRYR